MSMIEYEVDGSVGVISLNRPEKANAQSPTFLRELNDRWMEAAADDDVRVIVVRGNGRHFSSGHDFSSPDEIPQFEEGDGIRRLYLFEEEVFYGFSRAWRDVPKPSIAAVQGATVAAGLMLCWPCDLIIAADDARFGDPVIRLGVGTGVEYAAHTWEFGPRKAKELLFTGGFIDAQEALAIGMVNRVVPLDELDSATMALAREIAQMDPFALRMAKRSVNLTQDIQGFQNSLQAVFDMHWVCHANGFAVRGHKISSGITAQDMAAANRPRGAVAPAG
ncbi:MAG: enoyl-CoA hydratase [Acidimicrobiales bacterium]|jgi:enoyl-CoA hydratase